MPRILAATAGSFVLKAYFHRWRSLVILALLLAPLLWPLQYFAERYYSEQLAEQNRQTLDLYVANLLGTLRRYEELPQILGGLPVLRQALQQPGDPLLQKIANEALADIRRRTGADVIYLLQPDGTTQVASNWAQADSFVHRNFAFRPYYREAMQGRLARFFGLGTTSIKRGYYFASAVKEGSRIIGVLVVKVDLEHIERLWGNSPEQLLALAEQYNRDGFRVLLLGTRSLSRTESQAQYGASDERDLVIAGLLTFLDPPKETAGPAIAALRENGVAVKVLTGDNPVVSAKICREVGLDVGEPLLGRDIDLMDDATLQRLAEERTVFAKLTPLQKSRVLKALQGNGHTVGFLGDGINDAPALRDADVGISVDSGTDIAKESADIILLEKSLMVLEEGVIKGRETFGNIMKYLNMTASSNFGNVFSVLVASAFIPFLPMLAIHLLLQNLMYDISQLSLPWDKMDKEFLAKPRKWDSKNIGRFMVWIGPTSSIFDITTYALMWFVFAANSPEMQSLFQSGWFIEGLLSQTLVVHMLRTQKIPFIQSTAALPVMLMTGLVMALGIYVPFSPLGAMVGLQPLPWEYFPWLVGTLLCYCVTAQTMKTLYIRRFGQWF
ncbi:magnesium-translocating P-type ATPase [Pseudomonas aeruginosa]|nr:magnesium-translocating P-type ATPase [Pseudomonas aeruginosa]